VDARLHVLTGGSSGAVIALQQETLTLGRHPKADFRFDSETDLAVSAVHAVVTREGDDWYIQDLGSTNGTLVSGQRIGAAARLRPGDRIQLGTGGPNLEFRSGYLEPVATDSPATLPAEAVVEQTSARASPTGERIRVAVESQTRRLRVLATLCGVLLFAAVTMLVLSARRDRAVWDRERTEMREQIDSLLVAGEAAARSLQGQLSALGLALQESQELVRRTRSELAEARRRGDDAQVQQLERELSVATTTLSRQSSAAQLDFEGIQRRNRRAIALVYVESADGEVSTGTAFAIRSDATLMTNRHVVIGSDLGRPPRRIAVQFADSDQVWPARLLAVSRSADLAVLKVDNISGAVPVVEGLNERPDTLPEGAPVALIGFPNGGERSSAVGTEGTVARPILGSGVIQGTSAARLDIEGYGAAGASGSPVFDANGEVVGVLFGGTATQSGRMVFAVPAHVAVRFLGSVP
jgi:S1-C subfamily serine protease